ncbi:integrase arm-type DNA-binding domain-containing protein [Mameliella alba]|nr:integrase arm-type DNA-binding domain-containing protein [Mameliella alba]MBY6170190.1 integrase arm-type DNA-binding domain-containing protein [Mameliella alba]MBY6174833.1 integrase arm-type DNA-binding domain-containing protein [Mameliella alba]
MARHRLTRLQVKNATEGKHCDGAWLWLHKRKDGGAQWFLRYQVHGRRREMGLGSLEDVSLKEARETADRWRRVVREGRDPIKERDRLRREAAREDNTLSSVALEAFEARKASLKSDGKPGRWFSPLELHVLPKLGGVPIEQIDQQDIRNALAPIWHNKAETARKALQRLDIVMRHAAALGLDMDIQAPEKAKALLGKSRQTKQNIPAMLWTDVPAFYTSIDDGTITHLALRLLILTAVRSTPIRFIHLDEIKGNIWTVPAEKMKTAVEFRVPLSSEAQSVIQQAMPFERDGFLFPNSRKGVISDATMSRLMERRGLEARPHGFRSSFRTWCAEATDIPREIAEMALAHTVGSKVELSYRRTDYLERRTELMSRWSNHVTGKGSEILQLVANDQ